jgi:hypothetical protein
MLLFLGQKVNQPFHFEDDLDLGGKQSKILFSKQIQGMNKFLLNFSV